MQGDAFFLGLAYDHFIAGGDSIVALAQCHRRSLRRHAGTRCTAVALSAHAPTAAGASPAAVRWGLAALPAHGRRAAAGRSGRATVRTQTGITHSRSSRSSRPSTRRCRTAAKGWSVTLNDALLALLLLAQDAQMPDRDRAKRRHELAVASIMNLRDAHRRGYARHVRAVPELLSRFAPGARRHHARRARAATCIAPLQRFKREKLYLTDARSRSLSIVIARRFQHARSEPASTPRRYPVGAGVSTLNVNALWESATNSGAPPYIRGVPTGPRHRSSLPSRRRATRCARASRTGPPPRGRTDDRIVDSRHTSKVEFGHSMNPFSRDVLASLTALTLALAGWRRAVLAAADQRAASVALRRRTPRLRRASWRSTRRASPTRDVRESWRRADAAGDADARRRLSGPSPRWSRSAVS